nr:hypothetical protein [Actinomycetospora cinnamomea]
MGDVGLQRAHRPRRRLARPQVLDEPLGRHHRSAGGHEQREHRALPGPAEV